MKIASYNVQNLLERAVALSASVDSDDARQAIVKQGEINVLLRKATYDDGDRTRILDLLTELGLRDSDEGNTFVMLRQNHGLDVRLRNGSSTLAYARELTCR